MDTVFDVFETIDYTFYVLSRGGVTGNEIVSSHEANGVFKLRSDMVRNENSETKESNATLHIRPDENFLEELDEDLEDNLVGHGVHVNGKDYEIVGQTGGMNFDSGVMEHYTATLEESAFIFEESS